MPIVDKGNKLLFKEWAIKDPKGRPLEFKYYF